MEAQRTAVITITPDSKEKQVDIQKGAVSTYEIINILQASMQLLSKQLVQEYVEITGDKSVDPDRFEAWISFLRENKI